MNVYNQTGENVGQIEPSPTIFETLVNRDVLHQVVVMQLANKRMGTASTKGRSEVRGSGRKLYRQKGTGMARAGNRRSPLRVGGGVVFGPKPRDYSTTIPRKMRKRALCSALSCRAQEEKILVIDKFAVKPPKTKTVALCLEALSVTGAKNLFVVNPGDNAIYLSGRNIKNLQVKPLPDIHTYDVLNNENIIFTDKDLVEKVKEVVSL